MTKERHKDPTSSSSGMVQAGCRVRLAHKLTLADGMLVEESTPDDPLEFVVGDGTLTPALEARLIGMREGERNGFIVTAAEQVFGVYDPLRVQKLARREFPAGAEPAAGAIHEFHLPNGMVVAGTVREIRAAEVLVDFNPPLAGRDFLFEVTVLEVVAPA